MDDPYSTSYRNVGSVFLRKKTGTQIQVGDHLLFSANKDVVNDIRKKISKLNDYE